MAGPFRERITPKHDDHAPSKPGSVENAQGRTTAVHIAPTIILAGGQNVMIISNLSATS